MSLSTINNTEDKKENLKKIKNFHKDTLINLGIDEYLLIPKMAYKPSGKSELYISFFYNELSKRQDIYLEFTDRNNIPEDPNRTLYLWEFNPYFEEEYEKTETITNIDHVRYLVPVSELKLIKKYNSEKIITENNKKTVPIADFNLPNPETDPLINEMTIRDLAAIMLNKPVSNKEWLNMIILSKK